MEKSLIRIKNVHQAQYRYVDFRAQRFVCATKDSSMSLLDPPVQQPTQEYLESLPLEEKFIFQICGVLYKDKIYFDFIFSNDYKTSSGYKSQMTEHLISNSEAMIRRIDIYYHIWQGGNMLLGLIFKDKDDKTLLQCGYFE